jgi:transcriptional regulator with XRE-family HTH domain
MARDFDQSALVMFARELQAARSRAGMSRELLATKINYSPSLIGMVESCRRVPGLDFARRCDQVFGTTGTFERMQEHLRTAPFPAGFRPFVEYEARATALRGFEHVLVPGLVQTAEYARAVLATRPNTSEEQVDEFVTARLERQVILDRDEPPLLWLVIDEAVLHREVGGAKVMHDQLVHLAEMSERPNITIEVIPLFCWRTQRAAGGVRDRRLRGCAECRLPGKRCGWLCRGGAFSGCWGRTCVRYAEV